MHMYKMDVLCMSEMFLKGCAFMWGMTLWEYSFGWKLVSTDEETEMMWMCWWIKEQR